MTKRIEVTPLALKKAKRRGLSYEWIEETIFYPTKLLKDMVAER